MPRTREETPMSRPKRTTGAKPKKVDPLRQTVAELAARVKWLEECQRVNIKTVESMRGQVDRYAATVNLWVTCADRRFLMERTEGDALAERLSRAASRQRRQRVLVGLGVGVTAIGFAVFAFWALGL